MRTIADRAASNELKLWEVTTIKIRELGPKPTRVSNRNLASGGEWIHIRRPSFQRSLVWKKEKAKNLRVSLAKGYPFGILIFADEGVSSSDQKRVQNYLVIDGQQRTNWLNQMYENFFTHGWYSLAPESDAQLLSAIIDIENSAGLSSTHRSGMFELITSEGAMDSLKDFTSRIINWATGAGAGIDFNQISNIYGSTSALYELLQERRRGFGDIEVPLLIIKEELKSDLASVFERLNDSVALERFDIFAAQWSSTTVNLDSKDVDQDLSAELYRFAMERLEHGDLDDSQGYEVADIDEQNRTITLYEYFYSLSRLICGRYEDTIGAIPKAESEIVLHVAATLFAGGIQNMQKLGDVYPRLNGGVDVQNFPNALLLAAADIDSALSPLVGWDLGAKGSNRATSARQLPIALGLTQLASYLAAHISATHEVGDSRVTKKKTGFAALQNDFKNSLPSWWLHDALTGTFRGSGSDVREKAKERCWDPSGKPSLLMQTPYDSRQLGIETGRWVLDSLEVDATPLNRRSDSPATGAILRLVYRSEGKALNGEEKDHVIPFNRVKQSKLRFAPTHHVANWMPLNKTDNAARGDKYWPECINDESLSSRRPIIEARLFVPVSETGKETLIDEDSFRKFLVRRYNLMIPKLLDGLGHPFLSSKRAQDLRLFEVEYPIEVS